MLRFLLIGLLVIVPAFSAYGWDGYDYSNGAYVEIDRGNQVRTGEDIEVYDYSDNSYHDATVESVNRFGSSVEVEVYDQNNGEYRTFDMDD